MRELWQRHGPSVRRHITLPRLGNAALLAVEMGLRRTRTHSRPLVTKIEPTNLCNFQCPGCRTGSGEDKSPRGQIAWDDFQKIVDRTYKHSFKLILYMWGEPFINKNIYRMIEYAAAKNLGVQISTNLNVFRPEVDAPKVVASGLEHMIVALDGITQDVYEKYRVGGKVDKVINGVAAILGERARAGKRFPFVELQFIVFPHNRHQIEEVEALAHRLGVDRLTFIESKSREEAMVENGKPVLPEKCHALWTMACFNWDGSFSPCCDSVDDSFGNVLTEDFGSLLNSPKIQAARSLMSSQPQAGPPSKCQRCRIYHGYVTFLPEERSPAADLVTIASSAAPI
jgi:pyruvate-formate lyase-activating enzyme